MSETMEASAVEDHVENVTEAGPSRSAENQQFNRALNEIDRGVSEFEYRPMPVLAPVTMILGTLSGLALLTTVGIGFAVIGLCVGAICLRQIRRARGDLSGGRLAGLGTILSLVFFVAGTAWHSYAYATEVPEGFLRLNFMRDIASKEFVVHSGRLDLHPEVKPLKGKDIFVKGFIYQSKEATSGLPMRSFVLVKDNQACCFGANPSATDMIVVKMADDKTARFSEGLVSVAGKFDTDPPTSPTQSQPVYFLEAELAEPSRTAF